MNDLYETAKAENVVPLGLLTGAKLRCDVPTDAAVTYDMVDVIDNTTLYHLRAMQDAGGAGIFGRNAGPRGARFGRPEDRGRVGLARTYAVRMPSDHSKRSGRKEFIRRKAC